MGILREVSPHKRQEKLRCEATAEKEVITNGKKSKAPKGAYNETRQVPGQKEPGTLRQKRPQEEEVILPL